MSSENNQFLGMFAVIIAAILWGTTGVSASFAPEVSPIAIGAMAMGVGGLLQTAIAAKTIRLYRFNLYTQWKYLLCGGISIAIYPLVFYASMRLAGVTIGTVVSIGSAPLLSAVIEAIMEKARFSTKWIIGASLGIIGIILLSVAGQGHHTNTAQHSNVILGVCLGLLAGLTYALYSWVARYLMLQRIPSKAAMGSIFGIGGLLLMPVLFATGSAFLNSWTNASVGIYMALVPMFIGYLCFGYGLARIAASTAITITLLEPIVAALLAVIIIKENLSLLRWFGVALVFACLVCVITPTRKKKQ
ncbi:DMT family transporter [Commensalibacter communis]|uniref:DMT family transporter n=1 Tax=Commensalibacter communis TaxID=2972786 RepID=UPI0022FF6221|nr:EamA family transporter [Commensalibacter communis]CAI3954051.1 Permease of the drug/metabolite transporter (DMT) superfamily (RhaT) (PDB:5I20) [Commensalibacter communis]